MAKAQRKPFQIVPLPGDSSKQAAKPYDTRGLLKSRVLSAYTGAEHNTKGCRTVCAAALGMQRKA